MIEQLRGAGRDRFLADDGLQHQAERALQLAIQICIYVGAHLVAARRLRAPDEYRDVFERLSREDTLDAALPSGSRTPSDSATSSFRATSTWIRA